MKSPLNLPMPIVAFLLLCLSSGVIRAQSQASDAFGGAVDYAVPATPHPAHGHEPEWKDPGWKDPAKTLSEVTYDGVPVGEVAAQLRGGFNREFDVLVPASDWGAVLVTLTLRNVTASEVFQAMNLLFENDRVPLRWELKVMGRRQIALLRVTGHPAEMGGFGGGFDRAAGPERRIYFVGDLVGEEAAGGMTMEQIVGTVTEVWDMADTEQGTVKFHKAAQLLVVVGTPGQIVFIEETLGALRERARLFEERRQVRTQVPSAPEPRAGFPESSR